MGKLSGKTALVTGGARGLGRAYALRLADLGANVGIIDINLHSYAEFPEEAELVKGDTVVDELKAKGVKAAGVEADVSDFEQVRSGVAKLADELGDITILVANAGGDLGARTENRASEMNLEQFQKVTELNFYGTVYSVSAVAPYMKKNRYGKIVTVASEAGLQAKPTGSYAHYGSAKAAIAMYTRYLAQDLGEYGINVNCISPGFILTGLMKSRSADLVPANALGRFGLPEDCAGVIEFLVTDLSDYVTGAVIDASGGWVRAITL